MITCPCGLTHTPAEWLKLNYVDTTKNSDGDVEELRACSCGLVLFVTLKPGVTLIAVLAAVAFGIAVVGGLLRAAQVWTP